MDKVDRETTAAVIEWAQRDREYYNEYDHDGYNYRLVAAAAWQVMEVEDFEVDQHGHPILTDAGYVKLDAVFAALGYADRATDGNAWGDAIYEVAILLGLIPDDED